MQFTLSPFGKDSPVSGMTAELLIQSNDLYVTWQLVAETAALIIPPASGSPARVTGLWEHTCLELFIGGRKGNAYYELNLSPGGDWQIFHFEDVRTGRTEADGMTLQESNTIVDANALTVSVHLRLQEPIPDPRVNLTAVVESRDNAMEYFAPVHGDRPDFHRPDLHQPYRT